MTYRLATEETCDRVADYDRYEGCILTMGHDGPHEAASESDGPGDLNTPAQCQCNRFTRIVRGVTHTDGGNLPHAMGARFCAYEDRDND